MDFCHELESLSKALWAFILSILCKHNQKSFNASRAFRKSKVGCQLSSQSPFHWPLNSTSSGTFLLFALIKLKAVAASSSNSSSPPMSTGESWPGRGTYHMLHMAWWGWLKQHDECEASALENLSALHYVQSLQQPWRNPNIKATTCVCGMHGVDPSSSRWTLQGLQHCIFQYFNRDTLPIMPNLHASLCIIDTTTGTQKLFMCFHICSYDWQIS